MTFYWALAAIIAYAIHQANGFCERPPTLINGIASNIPEDKWKFTCDPGYLIQGKSEITCNNGLLRGERPFCATFGCAELDTPKNGRLDNPEGLKAEIMCNEGYVLVGNKFTYCDGYDWQFLLGTCTWAQNHSCDFESEDICGWTFPASNPQPWSRISTSANFHSTQTGALWDYTFQNEGEGHFIRMETQSGATGSYHFESPVFPQHLSLGNTTCFQFHYFMFGDGVGNLFVSVKPAYMPIVDMWKNFRNNSILFQKCGNLGNKWYEHTIPIAEMAEDFQVIFTVTDAQSRFGDIAIDDVKFLMTEGECKEAFVLKEPCAAKPTIQSGTDKTNGLQIYTIAFISLVAKLLTL